MAVDVILIEDFPSLGHIGDMFKVKPGYARNFLIPRGIAVDASSTNGKLLKHKQAGIQAKRAKLKIQAEEFGKKLSSQPLKFTLKAGESGKAFGAITAKDIETQLLAAGHEIHKKQIKSFDPIRVAGEYRVDIRIHADVTVSLPLTVVAEAKKEEVVDADAKPKRAPRGKAKKADTDVEDA